MTTRATRGIKVKVVTREREVDFEFTDLQPTATDAQIIAAAERRLETELKGFMVDRAQERILIAPSPVFG